MSAQGNFIKFSDGHFGTFGGPVPLLAMGAGGGGSPEDLYRFTLCRNKKIAALYTAMTTRYSGV